MKTLLLICFTFLTVNLSFGATHLINWTFGYHGTTNISIGDTVQWDFVGNHNVISDGSPTFTSSGNQNGGSYSVTFNTLGDYHFFCSIHGAGNMDGNIVVSPVLGVENIELIDNFEIYPNPSDGLSKINLGDTYGEVNLQVVGIFGKVVAIQNHTNTNEVILNTEDYTSGIYFIKVQSGAKSATIKLVVN